MSTSRLRLDDPYGLHRVRPHRRADLLATPAARTERRVAAVPVPPRAVPDEPEPAPEPAPTPPPRDAESDGAGESRDPWSVGWLTGALRNLEPEAVDHLLAASHEMLQAARAVVDAADAMVEEQRRTRRRGDERLRRIDVE
jgi:hypothetical protein